MSSVTSISVESENYPKAKNSWSIDLEADMEGIPNDMKIAFIKLYNNAVHDLVGAVAGKIGWEISKLGSGEIDREQYDQNIEAVRSSLKFD
jgi:hypothetical protein